MKLRQINHCNFRLLVAVLLNVLTVLGCTTHTQGQVAKLESLGESSVILGGDSRAGVFSQCSRTAPDPKEGLWTPTAKQVNAMWKDLPAFVAESPRHLPRTPLESYHRQYVGFIRGGRRFIYLNAFSGSTFREDWRKYPVIVCDGGSSFFGVEYDVEKGQLLNLEFNGVI